MIATCSVDGCTEPNKARGWCNKHYLRWQLHGSAEWGPTPAEVQPYAFVDGALSTEELLEGVTPLPRNVPVKEVPSARLLHDLSERHPFAVAFDAWARCVLGVHDADLAAWETEQAIDALRVDFTEDVEPQPHSERLMSNKHREHLFVPLIESGMTLREMSARLELPLDIIVRYAWGASGQRYSSRLADCEDALIAAGGPGKSASAFGRTYGIRHETVALLCERHHLPCSDAAREYERGRFSQAQIRAYLDQRALGLSVSDALTAIELDPTDERVRRFFRKPSRFRLDDAGAA